MSVTAAQLIARVRAEGVSQYVGDMRKLGNSTSRAQSVMNGLKGAFGGVPAILAAVGAAAATAGAAVLGIGIGAAKFSIDSALEFDTLSRKLEAFTGSAQEAGRLMKFIQTLAGPSLFETGDLAKGATLLAAYGLSVEKVLPLVDKLASAMGEGGESVSEVARIFGRLKSGDYGEAYERLRDFGISFDDLKAKGLQFSKSNEYLGTKLQALSAVAGIVEEKFGKISDVMRDSPAAKLASAMDAIRKGAVQAGQVFLTTLSPAVERFTKLVTFLSETNVFGEIAKGLTGVGDTLGKAFGATAQHALFVFVATLQEIPSLLGDIWKVFRAIGNAMGELFPVLKLVGFIGTVAAGLSDTTLGTHFAETSGRIAGRAAGMENAFGQSEKRGGTAAMLQPIIDAFSATGDDSALNLGRSLSDVADNTRRSAVAAEAALDLNRHALGGGNLGAIGVTPVEFGAHRRQSQPIRVDAGAWTQVVEDIARKVVDQVRLDDLRAGGR